MKTSANTKWKIAKCVLIFSIVSLAGCENASEPKSELVSVSSKLTDDSAVDLARSAFLRR